MIGDYDEIQFLLRNGTKILQQRRLERHSNRIIIENKQHELRILKENTGRPEGVEYAE